MHPYHHALSSQREHGGQAADYLPLHNHFDSSKSSLAHFTHRSINHHREGIQEAVRHFGPVIVNADGVAVSVETLALQHLAEDMSIIPSAADWLQHMELPLTGGPIRLPVTAPSAAELASASARHFNTDPGAMYNLHNWFLETAAWFADARHFAIRHHSFGIFEAVIWTGKPALMFASTEVVVPVVHRRSPAVRVARINAQAERTARRCLWTHRGEHRAVCHISYSPALHMGIINGRELRVAPEFGFSLRVDTDPLGLMRPMDRLRRRTKPLSR